MMAVLVEKVCTVSASILAFCYSLTQSQLVACGINTMRLLVSINGVLPELTGRVLRDRLSQ